MRLVLCVLATLLAGCTEPWQIPEPEECPGHWHHLMRVYIDEEPVTFAGYSLEEGTTPFTTHLHRDEDSKWRWHIEPPERICVPFGGQLEHVDMQLHSDGFDLEGAIHAGHGQAGEHRGQLFAQIDVGEGWRKVSAEQLVHAVLPDCTRILLVVGTADVPRLQADVPPACGPAA